VTEPTATNDDWLTNPAPPPRSLDPVMTRPANTPAPPAGKPAPKAARKPKAKLNPLDALGAALDDPPIAAAPGADAPRKRKAQAEAGPPPPPPDDPGPGPDSAPPPPPRRPKKDRPKGQIWEGCPVKPLGVNGGLSYYLDVHGQMRPIAKHDAQSILQLFGNRIPALCWNFPQWVKDPDSGEMMRKPGRFDQTTAAMEMIAACSELGLFDPDGAVRGVGAWVDDDGALIYHTGDRLLMAEGPRDPAPHQGRIYPAYPPIPHPAPVLEAPEPATDGHRDGPGALILDTMQTWQWSRPEIDPMIGLGMIGVQMFGGALGWRPTFWITGSRASGKSKLQDLIRHLHGTTGLIQSNDATKSGLTSRIGHSSLPVALDELEPGDEGSSKERDIIVLARVASSGGQWFRGSADQKGTGGNVYSTFLFSSILIPGAMKAQDLSRLITLNLNAFPEGTPPLNLRADQWRKRGAALKRILIDRWATWGPRLELWREAFAIEGLSGRNGDNWATVLAMADMALHPGLPDADTLTGWARKVARYVKADADDIGSDADAMLLHLLSQPFDIYRRGEQHTIAQWLMCAAQLPGAPTALMGNDTPAEKADRAKMANEKLAKAGLRVIGSGAEAVLFIASQPIQGLKDLFQRSEWANGVWTQSALRVTGAKGGRDVAPKRLQGIQTRGTEIPFTSLPGLMAFPADRAKAEAPPVPQPADWEDFA
jgi:hypothetical protein